jgi:hypothetical protein
MHTFTTPSGKIVLPIHRIIFLEPQRGKKNKRIKFRAISNHKNCGIKIVAIFGDSSKRF